MSYITTDELPAGTTIVDRRLRIPLAALHTWVDFLTVELVTTADGVKQKKPRRAARVKVTKRAKARTRRWKPGQLKKFRATIASKRAAASNGATPTPEPEPVPVG